MTDSGVSQSRIGQKAVVVISRLVPLVEGMLPSAPKDFPMSLLRNFLEEDDLLNSYNTAIDSITQLDEAWRPLMKEIVEACAFSAHAIRAPDHLAWEYLSKAQDRVPVIVLYIVLAAEKSHRLKSAAIDAKQKQTAANDPLRSEVLGLAALSNHRSVSAAAKRIVERLAQSDGGLVSAVRGLGGTLSAKGEEVDVSMRYQKRFAEYITEAVREAGFISGDERMTPSAFIRWRESFR